MCVSPAQADSSTDGLQCNNALVFVNKKAKAINKKSMACRGPDYGLWNAYIQKQVWIVIHQQGSLLNSAVQSQRASTLLSLTLRKEKYKNNDKVINRLSEGSKGKKKKAPPSHSLPDATDASNHICTASHTPSSTYTCVHAL